MLRDVLLTVLYLRQRHGPGARIVLSRIDVKQAYRQIPVDPEGASVFGYIIGSLAVVDLRLQFGCKNSPGFWGLFSAALEHAHTHTRFQHAVVSPQGASAVDHTTIVPSRGGEGGGQGCCRPS